MLKRVTLVLVLAFATSSTASAAIAKAPARLPFVQDDFARAQATARQQKLPMFVEVWAP